MNKNTPYYQQMMHWYAHQPVPPAWQMPPAQYPNPTQVPAPGYMPPPANAMPPQVPASNTGSMLTSSSFIKGALIGGAAAYLLTNEKVQQAVIKTAVKSWAMVQGGVEEMKERFRDAEAELHAGDFEE